MMRRFRAGSRPLTPRATRVRDAWLRQFAARRGLPLPHADQLARLTPAVSLTGAVLWWEKLNPPPAGGRRAALGLADGGRRVVWAAIAARVFVAITLAGFALALTPGRAW